MSEQIDKINEVLTQRVNNAYIAKDYTLLNGGTDNIVMINAGRDDVLVDILITFDVLEELVESLRALAPAKSETEKTTETEEQQPKAE